jgi:hypothetical protein
MYLSVIDYRNLYVVLMLFQRLNLLRNEHFSFKTTDTVFPLMLVRLSFSTLVFLVFFSQTFCQTSLKPFELQESYISHLKALI